MQEIVVKYQTSELVPPPHAQAIAGVADRRPRARKGRPEKRKGTVVLP